MSRLIVIFFIAGIGLIIMGAYEFYIQAGASSTPTTLSITELEKSVPWNRHLIVTGGKALENDTVVFYKTRNHSKVAGSEITFIPIQDASLASYRSLPPVLLVLVTESQMNAIKQGKLFAEDKIQGIRMTHLELESKAEDLLIKRYGSSAVKKMVIMEYEKEVTGVGGAIGQIIGGFVCFLGAIFGGSDVTRIFRGVSKIKP